MDAVSRHPGHSASSIQRNLRKSSDVKSSTENADSAQQTLIGSPFFFFCVFSVLSCALPEGKIKKGFPIAQEAFREMKTKKEGEL
jgi:hypothetical protein